MLSDFVPPSGIVNFELMRRPLTRKPVEGDTYFFTRKLLEGFLALDHFSGLNRPSSKDLRTFDEMPSAPTHKSARINSSFPVAIFTRSSVVGSMYSHRTPREIL